MKIVNPSVEIVTPLDGQAVLQHIEQCGRVCYKSEAKITETSAKTFVASIIKRGHEAVLEHFNITVKFICDRGVSHEIVRHRLASYAASTSTKPSTGASAAATTLPAVGDEVDFTGTKHYVSSNSTNAKSCKPGRAKVTALAKNGKHPVHLIRTSDGGSTVYGWADLADISTSSAAELRTHKVVKGDTLWALPRNTLATATVTKKSWSSMGSSPAPSTPGKFSKSRPNKRGEKEHGTHF